MKDNYLDNIRNQIITTEAKVVVRNYKNIQINLQEIVILEKNYPKQVNTMEKVLLRSMQLY